MPSFDSIRQLLSAWPEDCRPGDGGLTAIEALGGAGGFSGAELWRLITPRGKLCLRRWPAEGPDPERLAWIHAVLSHVAGQGIAMVPVPLPVRPDFCGMADSIANSRATFLENDGRLWELAPWMPGRADYHVDPRPEKLTAAMVALARFHIAVATFEPQGSSLQPTASSHIESSPGIQQRLTQVERLLDGDFERMRFAVQNMSGWPKFSQLANELLRLIEPRLEMLQRQLAAVVALPLVLQPCLRDIWHDHVLFEENVVTGIVDFGAMRVESPAGDVARLLGSLCGQDRAGAWAAGIAAYETVRPIAVSELKLLNVFENSTNVLSGVNWIKWVAIEGRQFNDPTAVYKRMEEIARALRG